MVRTLVLVAVLFFSSALVQAQGFVSCEVAIFDPNFRIDYAKKAESLRIRLLEDFEKFLRVYYELKQKSADPKMFMNYAYNPNAIVHENVSKHTSDAMNARKIDKMPDFNFAEFAEFKEELQADPRLAENLFVQKFVEYGAGAANDIFQRVGSYASANMRGPDFRFYKKDLLEFSVDMSGLAILSYPKIYNRVSAEYSYPQNYRTEQADKEMRYFDKIHAYFQDFSQ